MHLIGAHTLDNGGIHMAVRRAGEAGMSALQVFTAVPKFYNEKISVRPERVTRFREALAATAIDPRNVVSHAAYVLNVATAEDDKYARARAGLAKELERSTQLGIGAVCFHPGAATGGDRTAAAKRIADAIVHALKTVDGDTRLLVENTPGSGRTMGKNAVEMGEILAHVPKALRPRTGYGLDTCHLFVAGHDIAGSRERLTAVLDEFEEATGETPAFFHLNDSEGELGSARDRHALIGEGTIGVEAFGWLLQDRRSANVPLIVETPQENPGVADDDATPDPWDVRMMELLRGLAPKGTAR
jgi:deoxyribonuclease-4